jgi:hypothetical protein
MAGVSRPRKSFTPKQGQYLAFIHLYTRRHRRPPAETAQASSGDSQEHPAASNCSLIQSSCPSYFDHDLNRSKPLCRATSLSDTFVRHCQRIEIIASEKYGKGHRANDLILVLSKDLTPLPI